MKPTLHIMVGLPCSGKTTCAKALEKATGAIRFTPDEWQLRLFGQDAAAPEHDQRHDEIEALMRETAWKIIAIGHSVILDFGFWALCQRDEMREIARQLGADFRIHYMNTPLDEIYRRLDARNAAGRADVFVISQEDMAGYLPHWQPPQPDEPDVEFRSCER
ncbi:MAG: ATP-binding protein [Eubacteriales bacterium]|nr:ATP-binding protein [Eubacteriales bacterium]